MKDITNLSVIKENKTFLQVLQTIKMVTLCCLSVPSPTPPPARDGKEDYLAKKEVVG